MWLAAFIFTYIELLERPIDFLRIDSNAIVFWLHRHSSFVKPGDSALGELGIN